MRKLLLLFFITLLSIPLFAQLEVQEGSFKEVPGFVNINPDPNYQTDDNNLPFAVIKVRTENISDKQRRELKFSGNAGTFIMLEYKDGEVWVYLTAQYADYLKISHYEFSSIEFTLPSDLKPKCGYEMTLVNKYVPAQEGWGSLTIQTKPEEAVNIMLNGRLLPQKTPYYNDMIPSGKYEIIASKERFETTIKNIEIKDGENKVVEIEMQYVYGMVSIYTEPSEANVYIDNKYYGLTPLSLEKTIVIGKHEIKLEKSNCATFIKHFDLDKNNKLIINEKLETGREVIVSTNLSGDKIFIDDDYKGDSPLTTTMSYGNHVIKAIRNNREVVKNILVEPFNGKYEVPLVFDGLLPGVFTIYYDSKSNYSRKVRFSQGNLQYQASTNIWRFAENQNDYVGEDNKNISSSYNGWIDLFGWGTGDKPTKKTKRNGAYKQFTNWGNNIILNGGNYDWRLLTKDQWKCLLRERPTKCGIRYVFATVDGVKGLILLPDNWECDYYNLKESSKDDYNKCDSNIITSSDWINKLESNGAVFLPGAGLRLGTKYHSNCGCYWTLFYELSDYPQDLFFDSHEPWLDDYFVDNCRFNGMSVRLVCEVK